MILGLLPEIRGGLGELARSGQHSRFIDAYLGPYARAFDETRYFSYLAESLGAYSDDAELGRAVRVLPGGAVHPWLYTVTMPFRYAREMRGCSVLRVYHATGALPAVIAKRRFGVPFVTTYGFWYARLARSRTTRMLRRVVESLALATADAVIVTTPELRDHVIGRVRRRDAVHLIPNGVDLGRFHPGERPAGTPRRVLFVGRLSPEKGLDTLVAAMTKLRARVDVELVLVGDGPLRARLVRDAGQACVSLDLVGVVDHRALAALYASADVFVLPSLTEGHPKVLLEAMASGVACVTSDVPATRSVLADGDAGLLVPPGDAGALAGALERVLADQDVARELGARGRARAVAEYDLARLVGREIDLLRRVASAGGRRAS